MTNPETKLSKVIGVTLALIFSALLGIVASVIFLWKMLCAPAKWVAMAFADLLEDETHIEKITKQMKGEG